MFWELIDRGREHSTDFVGNQTQGPPKLPIYTTGLSVPLSLSLFDLYRELGSMDNCVRHDTFNSCVVDTSSSSLDFPGGSDGKAFVYNVRDLGSIPGLGRSPGEGNGNSLQYYCLENPMDRGAW